MTALDIALEALRTVGAVSWPDRPDGLCVRCGITARTCDDSAFDCVGRIARTAIARIEAAHGAEASPEVVHWNLLGDTGQVVCGIDNNLKTTRFVADWNNGVTCPDCLRRVPVIGPYVPGPK